MKLSEDSVYEAIKGTRFANWRVFYISGFPFFERASVDLIGEGSTVRIAKLARGLRVDVARHATSKADLRVEVSSFAEALDEAERFLWGTR